MAIITWLHLSDWHQGGGSFDRKVVGEALRRDIGKRKEIHADLEQLDFVFFSGDLAFSGVEKEYADAQTFLLDPVVEATGIAKERLFLIPGNHDIDRNAFDLLPPMLLKPFDSEPLAQEWLGNNKKRNRLREPFEAYQTFFESYKASGFGSYGDSQLVTVKGVEVGIMGCNSALMCGRKKDAQGEIDEYGALVVGEPQVLDALQKIENADVRIALIHHPFEWLKEFDRDRVEKRMVSGCDFILRGHLHKPSVSVIKGTMGDAVVIPGGACFDRRVPYRPEYANAYNFVRFDTETGAGCIYLRYWNDSIDDWDTDRRVKKDGEYAFSLRPPDPPLPPKTTPAVPSANAMPTPQSGAATGGPRVYISCSTKDRKWREEFRKRISPLLPDADTVFWDDGNISPGAKWEEETDAARAAAEFGLLFISPNYLASKFRMERDLPELLKKKILWIAVDYTPYEAMPFGAYRALNYPDKPLVALSNAERNKMWVEVVGKIKDALGYP